jgi:hypothetical protein
MTDKLQLQEALDQLWERYGNTLQSLSDALDQIDKLEKQEPKTITKEIEIEVEKIVEVERKVEVPKEVVVTREVEVPGPERIVTKTNPADPVLKREIKQLKARVKELEEQKEKIVTVEKSPSGDLKEAARLLATSEMNKEDLSEDDIYSLLQKSSEEETRRKIGFWATPLPDNDTQDTTKRYIGKK